MNQQQIRPYAKRMLRSIGTGCALALSVTAVSAGPSWSYPAGAPHPRIIGPQPLCDRPNCVEVLYAANGKTPPTVIRCKLGEQCHPQCRHKPRA